MVRGRVRFRPMSLRGVALVVVVLGLLALAPGARAATRLRGRAAGGDLRAALGRWRSPTPGGRPVLSEHPGSGPGPSGTLWGFAPRRAGAARHACVQPPRRRVPCAATLATTNPLGAAARADRARAATAWSRSRRRCGPGASPRRHRLRAPARRALPRLRRALERRRPARQRRRELRRRGPVPAGRATGDRRVRARPGLPRRATTRPTSRSRGCSRPPATACSWTTTSRATSASRATTPARGARGRGAPRLALRVFAGPTPADVLRRFTARTGRQPRAAAPWFFGPWFQPKGGDAESIDARCAGADVPASVVKTYTHYLPCGDQEGAAEPSAPARRGSHAAGLAVTTYFNPMICTELPAAYDQAAAERLLTKNALGQPVPLPLHRLVGVPGRRSSTSRAAAARAFFGGCCGEAVGDGYDGWMEDFGEYTPADSRSTDGTPGAGDAQPLPAALPPRRARLRRASARPLARFNRSGWTGAAPALADRLGRRPDHRLGLRRPRSPPSRNGLTMGLSGVSPWGSDIGGFFTLGAPQLDAGAAEALDRVRRGVGRDAHPGERLRARRPRPRPQITDPDVLPMWRRYAKLRTQLYPYLAAADARVPAQRAADHAPPRRSSTPATRGARARRPVHVRAGPAGRAGGRAGRDRARRAPARAAAGSTCGARCAT